LRTKNQGITSELLQWENKVETRKGKRQETELRKLNREYMVIEKRKGRKGEELIPFTT
jgi:hypothetical protein